MTQERLKGKQGRHEVQQVMKNGNIHRGLETRPVAACLTAAEPKPMIIPAPGGPSMTG